MDHYSDYFEMMGKNFRGTNGEHHEALHHSLKTMERDRNLYMKRNHGSPVHQQKSHQSISVRNALNAGFTPKAKLRIRKSNTRSESSNSPKSSPRKGVFNHSKSFVNIFWIELMNKIVKTFIPVFCLLLFSGYLFVQIMQFLSILNAVCRELIIIWKPPKLMASIWGTQ